jgi:pimeloyl-ACP methyl ester carboxylesterase
MNTVLSRDGTALAWTEAGSGKPVLLIHGFASTLRRNWEETGWMNVLARAGYRPIAYDQRGHGESEKRYDPVDYAPLRLVEDALAVLDAAAAEHAAVMGYSMGARVALEVGLRHPNRVRSLVLGGMGSEFRDFGGPRYDREIVARALEAEDTSGFAPGALFYRRFADQMHADRRALAACWRRPIREVDAADLAAVTVPVLLTVGDRDSIAGNPDPLASAMPSARVVRLAGKDHMSAVGAKQHREAVLAFLGELPD